jgi:hypothetical protein
MIEMPLTITQRAREHIHFGSENMKTRKIPLIMGIIVLVALAFVGVAAACEDSCGDSCGDGCGDCGGCNLGCTPGYWKHPDIHPWPSDAALPGDDFFVGQRLTPDADLDGDGDDDTYLDSLWYKGGNGVDGAMRILYRAATAAYLNEMAFDEDFTCGAEGSVYGEWYELYLEGYLSEDRDTIIENAELIDECNNSFCPLSRGD